MPAPTRAQLPRLAALAALSVPIAAGALLLSPSSARAAASPFTIACPKSDGSAGGAAVTGHGQKCGTYADAAPAIVTGSCQPLCLGGTTFLVTSPSGAPLFSASLDAVHGSRTYTVPAGSPDGTYTATLSGGGADVSASFVLQAAPTSSTAPEPPVTTSAPGGVVAPTTNPTKGPSTAAPSTSSSTGSAPPPSGGGAAPSTGHAAAVGSGGHQSVVRFPSLAPPAGIAVLPPLPTLPAPSAHREEGVQGPYGKTLPYDGSVTVGGKSAAKPTLLGHVADTVDDKQFAESIAAACLALLFAAHLRRLVRRPAGDTDL